MIPISARPYGQNGQAWLQGGTGTATEKRADRLHNPGLEEARADVIVAGNAILVAIMRFFDFDECLVSEADILDGLVLSLLRTS